MKRKIRRRCKCGCGKITNYGKRWINGHNSIEGRPWKNKKKQICKRCKCGCKGITNLGRKYINGHQLRGNTHTLGYKHTQKARLNMSLAQIKRAKNNPSYEYCDIWKDKEYKDDLRKDYCENLDCRSNSKILDNHHIDLNKKYCAPKNIMTLCRSCHVFLHNKLACRKHKISTANPKDYIIINRLNHISYIHKQTREIIRIIR